MVMTRSNGGSTTAAGDQPPRRVVARAPGMPTGRALVGGALVALAGVATFVTWQQSAGTPDHSYAVASRALHPGDAVTADAVRFVAIDLPPGVAGVAFPDPASLEGRVTVAPVAACGPPTWSLSEPSCCSSPATSSTSTAPATRGRARSRRTSGWWR